MRARIERRERLPPAARQRQQSFARVRQRTLPPYPPSLDETPQDAAEIALVHAEACSEGTGARRRLNGCMRQFVEHAHFGQRERACEQAFAQHAYALRVEAIEPAHRGNACLEPRIDVGHGCAPHRQRRFRSMPMSTIYLLLSSIWPGPARGADDLRLPRWSADVLPQELQRALSRELRRRCVEGAALIAIEAVIGGIDVYLHLRVRGGEFLHAVDRNHPVAFPEVSEDGAAWFFAARFEQTASVVRHGACKTRQPARTHPGDEATPAIADDADLSGPGQCVARGGDVAQRRFGCGLRLEFATACNVRGRIADVDAFFIAIEQRRRDDTIAIRRVSVADTANMAVDAEYFLRDDESAARQYRRDRRDRPKADNRPRR